MIFISTTKYIDIIVRILTKFIAFSPSSDIKYIDFNILSIKYDNETLFPSSNPIVLITIFANKHIINKFKINIMFFLIFLDIISPHIYKIISLKLLAK